MTTLHRITLFAVALVLVSGGAIIAISLWISQSHEGLEFQQQVQSAIRSKSEHLRFTLLNLADDVRYLGAIATTLGVGTKPPSQWQQPLQDSLYAFLQSHDSVVKARIIDINHQGKELLRLNHFNDTIDVVAASQLQHKSGRPYFYATEQLQRDEIHISPLNLNHDFGKVMMPPTPIMRVSTPLFAHGEKVALISLSLRMQPVLDQLKRDDRDKTTYLLNQAGDILLGPDSHQAFSFEFGQQQRLQHQFPALTSVLASHAPESGKVNLQQGRYAFYLKIFFDPLQPERFLLLIEEYQANSHAMEEMEFSLTEQLIVYFLLLLLAIAAAVRFSRHITTPLGHLQRLTERLATEESHDDPPISAPPTGPFYHEVTAIINALATIATQQHAYRQQLAQQNRIVAPLQKMEQMHSQRERRMVELKQEVNSLHQKLYGSEPYDLAQIESLLRQHNQPEKRTDNSSDKNQAQ